MPRKPLREQPPIDEGSPPASSKFMQGNKVRTHIGKAQVLVHALEAYHTDKRKSLLCGFRIHRRNVLTGLGAETINTSFSYPLSIQQVNEQVEYN